MKVFELALNDLNVVVGEVMENFSNGVIILQGDLAAGKTTFVKEFVQFLGFKDSVTSPTFSLQQCYGEKVYHYDLYNHGLDHFLSLGMLEEFEKDGLHFVEWGDEKLRSILDLAEINNMTIFIKKISQNLREYRVEYA